jgi:hypothetical protein
MDFRDEALQRSGITPQPFAPEERTCHGATTTHDGINRDPVQACYPCQRRGRMNGSVPLAPAMRPDGTCINFVPLGHGADCSGQQAQQPSLVIGALGSGAFCGGVQTELKKDIA